MVSPSHKILYGRNLEGQEFCKKVGKYAKQFLSAGKKKKYSFLSCIENDKLDLPAMNWKGLH